MPREWAGPLPPTDPWSQSPMEGAISKKKYSHCFSAAPAPIPHSDHNYCIPLDGCSNSKNSSGTCHHSHPLKGKRKREGEERLFTVQGATTRVHDKNVYSTSEDEICTSTLPLKHMKLDSCSSHSYHTSPSTQCGTSGICPTNSLGRRKKPASCSTLSNNDLKSIPKWRRMEPTDCLHFLRNSKSRNWAEPPKQHKLCLLKHTTRSKDQKPILNSPVHLHEQIFNVIFIYFCNQSWL